MLYICFHIPMKVSLYNGLVISEQCSCYSVFWVCLRTCEHVRVCTETVPRHSCIRHPCIHMDIYVFTCLHLYLCMCVYVCVCIYVRIVHIYIHLYLHTYICVRGGSEREIFIRLSTRVCNRQVHINPQTDIILHLQLLTGLVHSRNGSSLEERQTRSYSNRKR